jgi:organic radical activating enzyme
LGSAAATTSLRISELFLSIQGEGPSAGTPAHFLRLQGCDVGCTWCDTKYSWASSGGFAVLPQALWERAHALGEAPLLVITGGEPLEHQAFESILDEALERWPCVEVETSGIAPPPRSHGSLAWNVSPKLPSATPRWRETWRHTAAWLAEPRATFKIVVAETSDLEDALHLLRDHAVPSSRVMLMPEGMTDETLRMRAAWLAEACKQHGFRLSPRLHIWMWGARRGV